MAINYIDYILGGFTTAKPSIQPNVSASVSSFLISTSIETRSISAPLSQAVPKKHVNLLEANREISISKSSIITPPEPELVKTFKKEDPLGASMLSKLVRSSPSMETAKPILQSGDSRPMLERIAEVLKLLQTQISLMLWTNLT